MTMPAPQLQDFTLEVDDPNYPFDFEDEVDREDWLENNCE